MTRDMQDKLEKFVQKHREEFDAITPQNSVWEGIRSDLDKTSRTNTKMFFWRAAAIILFIFSVGLTFYVNKESIIPKGQKLSNNKEFVTTEKYYTSIIQEREQLVKMVAAKYPDIETEFESDWNTLDENYSKLKKEYKENQSEEVLHALVQNLQSRVNLLNKQLEVIGEMKTEEKDHLKI